MHCRTPVFDRRLAALRPGTARRERGFSLAELLVVIGIIGVLAAIGLPALRGLGESNAIDAATRQMLDDLAYARLRAINDRTTVYMVFVPPDMHEVVTNLAPYRLTGYTLYSRRSVGEQPGRASPKQLIPWRNLPDKTFFPISKFTDPALTPSSTNLFERPFARGNNFFLTITNRPLSFNNMPYLAFSPQGQTVRFGTDNRPLPGEDEYLALAKGSVVHPQEADGHFHDFPDVVEVPVNNRRYIRVNWLTGRAQVVGDLLAGAGGQQVVIGAPE